MKKKKIGLWLLSRKNFSPVSVEKPGMWIRSFRDDFVKKLKKEKGFEVIENLDFRKAIVKNGEVFLKGFCFSDLDLFFWFGEIERQLDSYHIEILEAISDSTVVVNHPRALKIGLDKFYSQLQLKKSGVTVPDFFMISKNNLEEVRKEIEGRKFILKPRLGSCGLGIMKVSSYQSLVDIIDYSNEQKHFLEEFIEYDLNDWIGINVVNQKVIYSYGKQSSMISGWKVFDRERRGGKMILKKPSKEQEQIALKVGKVTGLDVFGVDIIKSRNGKNFVIDVNTFPGLYPEMFRAAGIDGAKVFIDLIKSSFL